MGESYFVTYSKFFIIFTCMIINLLWTILLLIGLANAQPITYTYKYALETPVNIRSGQSSKHDIVGQLKKDERFEMDAACKSGWCRARAGSIYGWVHISQAKQAPTPAKTIVPAKAADAVKAVEVAKAVEPAKAAEPANVIKRISDSVEEWWAMPLTILGAILGLFLIWKFRRIAIKVLAVVFGVIGNIAMACLREILRDISKGGFSSGGSGGGTQRSIYLAKQKGNFVYVYDEPNHSVYGKQGYLHGYTSSTVSIINNQRTFINTFDIMGNCIGSTRM